MRDLLRSGIEYSVRQLFGVDVYPDAFEKLAILDRSSVLSGLFQHKVRQELKRHPLLFIHVPKNGGTSLKRALYTQDPGHSTLRFYEWLAAPLRAKSLCFALVRDPVDRFLSGFDFLMNGGGSDVSIQPAARRRLAHIRSVDSFLDHLQSIGDDWFKVDTFARPQWWYIADRSAVIAIDHLWIVGEQDAEIAALLDSHGFPPPPHVNRTRRATRQLSSAQRARIERIYAPDLAIYETVARLPGASRVELAHIQVPQV
jgi:hypothetical protein